MSQTRQNLLPLVDQIDPATGLTGKVLNVHRAVANSPQLLAASAPMRNYLVKESHLTKRQREVIILRTAYRLGSTYEITHHLVRGRAAGLSDEEMDALGKMPVTALPAADLTLVQLVDDMIDAHQLGVDTAQDAIRLLGRDGTIDAIYTVGFYVTLGTILETFAVPLDDAIEPL